MPSSVLLHQANELLNDLPWSVVLPAGCGKTELIAAMCARIDPSTSKPLLVLTHTNAGVDVIRKRFAKYGVTPLQARVYTLDSWAKQFHHHFPSLSQRADVRSNTDPWERTRLAAVSVLSTTHIGDIVSATYRAAIVDEYQDCSRVQHDIVVAMNQYIPIGVFGDPLQGIFDFGGGVVDWESVEDSFPPKAIPITPHRWQLKNPDLGNWLLSVRRELYAGSKIDFNLPGLPVLWKQTNRAAENAYCTSEARAANPNTSLVILNQVAQQCYSIGRSLRMYSVAEEVQCNVVMALMLAVDSGDGAIAAAATIKFVRECCVGCASAFNNDLVTFYANGDKKSVRNGANAAAYTALNSIADNPQPESVRDALVILAERSRRIFRHEAWWTALKTLDELTYSTQPAAEVLDDIRNRSRYSGQPRYNRLISRTLLVKGQEFDQCIILGADGMTARNVYVALTRGVERVTIFSDRPSLFLRRF